MRAVSSWFTRHRGGEMVPEGVYWNLRSLRFIPVDGVIDFLPGKRSSLYLRVPVVIAAVLALLLGLVYLIALPLLPIFILGWLAVRGAGAALRHASSAPAQLRG